jgi:MFS family permease
VTVQPLPDERASALLRVGLAIAAITVTAQAVAHVVGVQLLDDRYLHLNADDELGLPAWVSSSATFTAAFAAFVLALMQDRIDRSLLVLAGLLAFFSLDDAIAVHERLGEKAADALGYGETAQRLIWPVLFLPLLALAALLLVRTARRLPEQLAGLVYLGLGLLGLALATELVSSALYELADVERGSWPDTVEVVLEESAELAAWIVIATALLAALSIGAREDRAPLRRKVPA